MGPRDRRVTFLGSAAFLSALRSSRPATRRRPRRACCPSARRLAGVPLVHVMWTSVAFFSLYIAFRIRAVKVLGPVVSRRHLARPARGPRSPRDRIGALLGGLVGLRWRPRHPLRATFLPVLPLRPFRCNALWPRTPALGWIVAVALFDALPVAVQHLVVHRPQQHEVPAGELSRASARGRAWHARARTRRPGVDRSWWRSRSASQPRSTERLR